MSSKNSKKSEFSQKILKNLGRKSAVSVKSLKQAEDSKESYALARSLKNLVEAGLVELHDSGQQEYAVLTQEGRHKLNSLRLTSPSSLVAQNWDGFWRIILLDLPEERKSERESLRYLLKKAGFVCLKNSAWISPFPYEHLFENIKKDLGLSTEMMIIVTQLIDEETQKHLFETFGQ